MWWRDSKYTRPLKGAAALALIAAVGLGAGGCGIHPLYGTTASGAELTDAMKSVDIPVIPGRTGQRLRNELIFGTTGGAGQTAAAYRLDIALRESTRNTLVNTQGSPTGQVVELEVEYRLVRLKDNAIVFKAFNNSQATYYPVATTGLAGSTYGDTRAVIDAEDRAAKTLADTIKTRVAAYLSSNA